MAHTNLGSSPPAPTVDTLLLATKLYVPRVSTDTVRRQRLTARLDHGLQAPLTLLAAPAGFGKTTTVIQWLHDAAVPVAWLSLDARDNDPATFLRYLVAALRTVAPAVGTDTLTLLAAAQPPPVDALLTPLLNELAVLERDLVLVLDDYHALHAAAIHDAVAFLVEHLPPRVHLVITTREDPPLPITRLRVRRQLVELRVADLRFTTDEAAAFLHDVMRLHLSPGDVAALEERTEGWIAGLHLAALAMQGRPDAAAFVRAFTGSNRFIVEYLVEEVVARLPTHLYQFVLQTSLLDRFCAPLCDALVLGEAAGGHASYSQLLIDQIARMNLFVIPLDDERRWYRYHHLFADALRERMEAGASRTELDTLYRRASRWCEAQGWIAEAIQYAIRGQDSTGTADLLERYGDVITMQRGPAVLLGWIAGLPHDVLAARPGLALIYAMGLALTDRLAEAEALVDATEPVIHAQAPDGRGPLAEQAAGLRTTIALMTEAQPEEIIAHGRHTFDIMADPTGPAGRSTGLMLGCGYAQNGEDDAAMHTWQTAMAACRASGDGLMEIIIAAHTQRVLQWRGQLRQAETLAREYLARADEEYLRAIPVKGYMWTFLAWILYERNAMAETRRLCRDTLELSKGWLLPRFMLYTHTIHALARQAGGDVPGAQLAINTALQLIEHNQWKQTFVSVPAYQARIWLMQGNLPAAALWSQPWEARLHAPLEPAHDVDYLTLARVLFRQGRLAEAEELLARIVEQAATLGRSGRAIEGHALQALVAHAQRDDVRAFAALKAALLPAELEGYVRLFVDEGEPMRALLLAARRQGLHRDYVDRLLAAFPEGMHDAGEPMQPAVHAPQPASAAAQLLEEALSERELEVLRLLATGLPNQAIAAKLIVGPNTIKKHLSNIYAKLGVQSRTEALVRARELHLL